MPRTESVTTPQTPGAGRRMSYSNFSTGSLSIPNQPSFPGSTTPRAFGVPQQSFYDYITVGAPAGPQGGVIYKGQACVSITSNTLVGRYMVPDLAPVNTLPQCLPIQTERGSGSPTPGNPTPADDFACWSVSAMLAFDAIPAAITGDIGLSIGVVQRWGIRSSTFAGTEFGPSNTGVISVIVRQADGGALTFNSPVPDQPTMTEWNTYEIRLISATSTAEAQIKYLINGRLQFALSYGAGTVLMPQVEGTGIGFTPGLGNYNAITGTLTRMYIVPSSFVVKAAPSEIALL